MPEEKIPEQGYRTVTEFWDNLLIHHHKCCYCSYKCLSEEVMKAHVKKHMKPAEERVEK